jgi:hypothetical protein
VASLDFATCSSLEEGNLPADTELGSQYLFGSSLRSYPLPFRRLARGTFAPSLDAGAAMEENYPFAITGINLTNLLFEILGWGMVRLLCVL